MTIKIVALSTVLVCGMCIAADPNNISNRSFDGDAEITMISKGAVLRGQRVGSSPVRFVASNRAMTVQRIPSGHMMTMQDASQTMEGIKVGGKLKAVMSGPKGT